MPDNNAPVQQTPAQPSPQPLEVSDQSFRRMPSQRRRRLWMLAARAAAQKEHISHEREVLPPQPPPPPPPPPPSTLPGTAKQLSEHRGSSLLAPAKPGTVRTQDSGISSMDYVTSREANSPNSEDAGLVSSATAGSSRPRANTTAGLLLCDRREPRVCSEVDTRPRLSIGPPFLSPHASTAAATTGAPNFRTEITIPKGDGEYRQPDYSSHLSTQRYTALCHNYVPDWVRRNWSSAPRPLIPRQRSSVETTGMETSNDWTSMEALNIQHSLYPYNWRLYSGRYGGRFSCPKASVFFESFLNDPSTVHLETAEEEDDDGDENGGATDVNESNCGVDRNTGGPETRPQASRGETMSDANPGGGNPNGRRSSQADLDNPGGSLTTSVHLRRRRRPGFAIAASATVPPLEPEDLPQFSRSRNSSYAFLPQRIPAEPAFPLCWCERTVAVAPCPPSTSLTERAYPNPADFLPHRHPGAFAYHRSSSHTGTSGLSPLLHCRSCPFRFMPHSECSLNVPCHQHPHHYHHCPACCLDYDSHPHNIPYGQGLGRPLPQYDLPQRHVRRRMLKRMASEPLPPTWTTVSPGVSVAGAGDSADSPLGSTAPPRKRATPKSLVPGPVPVPSTAITIVQPPIPARRAHTASPPAHIYADTRIIDYRASGGFSHEMGTGGAEVYIRTPDTTAAAAAAAAATTSSADLPTTRRPDVRVHRSLRAGTGLIRGRSVDEAFSSQSRGTEPFAGRGEGGALSYQQPYRMTASDFQIAHRPYRAPAAGWEEKQASLLTEDDPICCHGLVPSQAGGHFYRPRLCPHIYEEDESAWKPYEVSVEAAPGRLGSFYPTQRIRPASCRPFIQSSWLASPQMDRPLSEGVPQPPPPPPPTVRCPFTRPWRGSRRGRGYTRSASYSMRSLEDSPASDFGPPPPPLPLDHPPWQKLAPPSAEAWGRARSLQVDASVSTSTSVPASPLEGRHASHLCPRPLWRLGSSESRSDTTQSARPSSGSRQRIITQPLHNEPFPNGHASAVRRQDLQWKRKSFKRSNGYDAADLERAASFDSYGEEIEPLVQASSMSNPQDVVSDYSARPDSTRGPTATCTTSDLVIGQREQLKPQPSDDTDVVIECPPDEVDDICEAGESGGGGGDGVGDTAHEDATSEVQAGSADAGSPGSHRVIRVVAESGSRTPSRTSHPPSRQVLSELAALGFNNRNEYWEHSAFGRARICAICLAGIASLCLLYSFSSSTWAYSGLMGNVTRRGLWMKCYQPNRTCHAILPFISAKDGWQGGAVCILLAAIGLGLLGIGLSVVGYSGSDLLKRLYYFHSGGEIFFLAGFTTFLSLGIYRSYAQSNLVNAATGDVELTFGAADTVGWVAGVLYFITAFCLLMDEFIHEMAKMSTRWPCLGVLLRFGALQIARFSRWRHACSLRWRRCCKRGRRQKRLSRVPMSSTSATATHSSSFGLLETAYRPTTGQLISKKRGRRS